MSIEMIFASAVRLPHIPHPPRPLPIDCGTEGTITRLKMTLTPLRMSFAHPSKLSTRRIHMLNVFKCCRKRILRLEVVKLSPFVIFQIPQEHRLKSIIQMP
ncbi:uncharacterized protein MYCGRDRAFT_101080 [Zymoseptoria tritici IPO323]|uniref:Uncharacterized protein n=1 Tax=Zymoseptoria tritici (strain CBS 115943 / IPO323) TaxID=336722 RepID=F9XH00_ZYMTI|nr:uncharacterized protein MYCGRDRAFT_101080 [Zymoseptoria tritici IPO323]EGP85231.1 hypothetical protein MYCGRDRAFT_101080 [Zymoseptoria tritici IPO323]